MYDSNFYKTSVLSSKLLRCYFLQGTIYFGFYHFQYLHILIMVWYRRNESQEYTATCCLTVNSIFIPPMNVIESWGYFINIKRKTIYMLSTQIPNLNTKIKQRLHRDKEAHFISCKKKISCPKKQKAFLVGLQKLYTQESKISFGFLMSYNITQLLYVFLNL